MCEIPQCSKPVLKDTSNTSVGPPNNLMREHNPKTKQEMGRLKSGQRKEPHFSCVPNSLLLKSPVTLSHRATELQVEKESVRSKGAGSLIIITQSSSLEKSKEKLHLRQQDQGQGWSSLRCSISCITLLEHALQVVPQESICPIYMYFNHQIISPSSQGLGPGVTASANAISEDSFNIKDTCFTCRQKETGAHLVKVTDQPVSKPYSTWAKSDLVIQNGQILYLLATPGFQVY